MKTYEYVYRLNEDKLAECKIKAIKWSQENEENADATPSEGMGYPVGGQEGTLPEGTKITKRENKEKDNNKSGGAVDENDERVVKWQKFMANEFGVELWAVGTASILKKGCYNEAEYTRFSNL